jgi:hypothetical protein
VEGVNDSISNNDIKMAIRDLNGRLEKKIYTKELLENTVYTFKLAVMDTQKLRIYKTLIQPVLSYGCEAGIMTQSSEESLATFARKILRRIFGRSKEMT